MRIEPLIAPLLLGLLATPPAHATDTVPVKQIGLELA
jgi:hypothetical protein